MLKKLNGARFWRPSGAMVETSAIGRGVTALMSILYVARQLKSGAVASINIAASRPGRAVFGRTVAAARQHRRFPPAGEARNRAATSAGAAASNPARLALHLGRQAGRGRACAARRARRLIEP